MAYPHNPFLPDGYVPMPSEQFVDFGVSGSQPQFTVPIYPHAFPYRPTEYHEVYFHPIEDYDEYTENLTRPRLTKEQVDILEAQFQAQPKPNSDVKRQLAIQTNLTLPRVANWFQNRRAKAKQQKRQAEFERMQALAKAEQSKQDHTTNSDQNDAKEKQQQAGHPDSSTSPTQEPQETSKTVDVEGSPTVEESKEEQTVSKEVNPKTVQPCAKSNEETGNTTVSSPNDAKNSIPLEHMNSNSAHDRSQESRLSEIGIDVSVSSVWTPQPAFETVPHQRGEPLQVCSMGPNEQVSSIEPWLQEQGTNRQLSSDGIYNQNHGDRESIHVSMSTSLPSHLSYTAPLFSDPFSNVNSEVLTAPRRGSCSSDQADMPNHACVSARSPISEKSAGSTGQVLQISPFSRQRERKVDLAARRKRPRPAAIGTTGLGRSYLGPSSMSPTTRLPNHSGQVLRHVKSTQNLSSTLSPRYPGVRKMSAVLRSPLGFTSSFESNIPHLTSTELTVPTLGTTSITPSTPLTPEDLQYLLPPTPNDHQYCVSPSTDMGCSAWYPTSRSLPLYTQTPPTTPLHPAGAAHLQYQTARPPFSASAQHTTLNNCAISEQLRSTGENAWDIGQCIPVPEGAQEPAIQMPQPVHISSLPCDETALENEKHVFGEMPNHASSPQHALPRSQTPPTAMLTDDATLSGTKSSELYIQEFEQQGAHNLRTEDFLSQQSKTCTISHQTPISFK
ncbi:hypothetical protein VTO42DRAFT_1155 [Malbranchea cinnamomea]